MNDRSRCCDRVFLLREDLENINPKSSVPQKSHDDTPQGMPSWVMWLCRWDCMAAPLIEFHLSFVSHHFLGIRPLRHVGVYAIVFLPSPRMAGESRSSSNWHACHRILRIYSPMLDTSLGSHSQRRRGLSPHACHVSCHHWLQRFPASVSGGLHTLKSLGMLLYPIY